MKIGMIDVFYGTPKGHSYINRDLLKIFMDANYEVHIYRIGHYPLTEDFEAPTTMTNYIDGQNIPENEFKEWVKKIKPDIMFFNEYNQWWEDTFDKIDYCKKQGIKTVGYLVWEKLDWDKIEQYNSYDVIIAPTKFQQKLYKRNGVFNSVYTPWGTFLDEYDKIPAPTKKDKIVRFYHCAGSGGFGDRKNTSAVVEAYKQIQDENTDLIITHLNSKVFSRKEILSFMKYSDVLINASRWDTLGLNTIEANACGIPVIVCDTDPMNELVINNVNGSTVTGTTSKVDTISCLSYNVDVDELAKAMSIYKQPLILNTLKNNSKKIAETKFNWKNNQDYILEVFKEEK